MIYTSKKVGQSLIVKGKDDKVIASFTPEIEDSFLEGAKVEGNNLVLTVKLADGSTKDLTVDLSQYIDTYTAGTGLMLDENTFVINIKPAGETDLVKLTANLDGIGIDATKLDAKLTELTQAGATYLTNAAAQDTYLTKVDAEKTYMPKTEDIDLGTF